MAEFMRRGMYSYRTTPMVKTRQVQGNHGGGGGYWGMSSHHRTLMVKTGNVQGNHGDERRKVAGDVLSL